MYTQTSLERQTTSTPPGSYDTRLEKTHDRYKILLLVKRVGKLAGFTPRMIHLLDYYMAYTRECDWEEGAQPIIFQSQARTALDVGVSERQIQKLERQLSQVGALCWKKSGNHKRYGQRCSKTGRILYAFGVDLSPLAKLKEALEEKLEQKQAYDQKWMDTKRQISFYRAQIREHLNCTEEGREGEELQESYNAIAISIRTYMDLNKLKTLLQAHKDLLAKLAPPLPDENDQKASLSQKRESVHEQKDAHIKSTTQKPFNKLNNKQKNNLNGNVDKKQLCQKQRIMNTGLQHITLGAVLEKASKRFMDHIDPRITELDWSVLVQTASLFLPILDIPEHAWRRACTLLGRNGAVVVLILTERAAMRDYKPAQNPAAYFSGMLNRAERGTLHLEKAVYMSH